jgi:hypothetical protein
MRMSTLGADKFGLLLLSALSIEGLMVNTDLGSSVKFSCSSAGYPGGIDINPTGGPVGFCIPGFAACCDMLRSGKDAVRLTEKAKSGIISLGPAISMRPLLPPAVHLSILM